MNTFMTTTINLLLLAMLFSNIAEAKKPVTWKNLPAKSTDTDSLTEAHNIFGFKILKELQDSDKNVFISPTSISTAFGMLHNGTVGAINEEFNSVFGWRGLSATTFNLANRALLAGLRSQNKSSKLEIANSIWIRQDFRVKPLFKKDQERYFNAVINSAPFNSKTVKRINLWTQQKTHGKIKEVIKALRSNEIMVLVNAVYFKGAWTKAFNKYSTRQRPFTLSNNSHIKVPIMQQEDIMEYAKTKDYQAVRLPFGKGDMAMTFILPTKGLRAFQQRMTAKDFGSIQSKFYKRKIELYVPRFKIKFSKVLNEPLKRIGLRKSFRFSKGFSKITDKELAISQVIHKTFVEVKEEGAEAAAVTAIKAKGGWGGGKPRVEIMKLDRPFMLAITHVKSGGVLFLGTIYNPLN
jgi:serine protease inhibitor